MQKSKNITDAAADAGVKFIVHLGIFGIGCMTNPHLARPDNEVRADRYCHNNPSEIAKSRQSLPRLLALSKANLRPHSNDSV
jgi:hypothetical protein